MVWHNSNKSQDGCILLTMFALRGKQLQIRQHSSYDLITSYLEGPQHHIWEKRTDTAEITFPFQIMINNQSCKVQSFFPVIYFWSAWYITSPWAYCCQGYWQAPKCPLLLPRARSKYKHSLRRPSTGPCLDEQLKPGLRMFFKLGMRRKSL